MLLEILGNRTIVKIKLRSYKYDGRIIIKVVAKLSPD